MFQAEPFFPNCWPSKRTQKDPESQLDPAGWTIDEGDACCSSPFAHRLLVFFNKKRKGDEQKAMSSMR
jgi:hypothetical protein